MSKNIENISLYDLMAEDLTVWISRNKTFGYNLEIEGDDPSERISLQGLHAYAMESFSDFCRRFLHFYDQVKNQDCAI